MAGSQRQHRGGGGSGVSGSLPGGRQRVGSMTAAGMVAAAAASAVLSPRAVTVAMKTPVATAMAGASTKSSNGDENGSTVAVAAPAWQRGGGSGGQFGGRGGSLAEVQIWQQGQCIGKRGNQQLE